MKVSRQKQRLEFSTIFRMQTWNVQTNPLI